MRISDIKWSRLTTCQGHSDPAQLPTAIEHLLSSDVETRKRGYWGIDNHAVVQSDLYNSAPYVARVLVDKITSGQEITEELTDILIELYLGSSPEILDEGPLAGRSVEYICKEIVLEAKPYFVEAAKITSGDLKDRVLYLVEVLENGRV